MSEVIGNTEITSKTERRRLIKHWLFCMFNASKHFNLFSKLKIALLHLTANWKRQKIFLAQSVRISKISFILLLKSLKKRLNQNRQKCKTTTPTMKAEVKTKMTSAEKQIAIEDLIENCRTCKEIKKAISIVADSAAVDCLIDGFEVALINREYYAQKLCQEGLDDRVESILNTYSELKRYDRQRENFS